MARPAIGGRVRYTKRQIEQAHAEHLERARAWLRDLGLDPDQIDDGHRYGILYDVGTMLGFMSATIGQRHESAIDNLALKLRERIAEKVIGHEFGGSWIYRK